MLRGQKCLHKKCKLVNLYIFPTLHQLKIACVVCCRVSQSNFSSSDLSYNSAHASIFFGFTVYRDIGNIYQVFYESIFSIHSSVDNCVKLLIRKMISMKILCLALLVPIISSETPQHSVARQVRHWIYLNIADNSQRETRDLIETMLQQKFPKLSFLVIVYASDFGLNQHHTNADVQISR